MARHFYNLDELKAFAGYFASIGGDYLHLHFSDDQGFAVESELLGQRSAGLTANADGSYTNPVTGGKFLSKAQMREFAEYCKAAGLGFVPELDTPGHCSGLNKLYVANEKAQADYPNLFTTPRGVVSTSEISFTNSQDEAGVTNSSRYFVRALINELLDSFGSENVTGFHLGGDEFAGSANPDWAYEHVNYFNFLAEPLISKGLEVMVWNDGLLHGSFDGLNKKVTVNYWRWYNDSDVTSGDAENLKKNRVTPADLVKAGYKVRLANAYYTYAVPVSDASAMTSNAEYAANDARSNWNLTVWNNERGDRLESADGIAGSIVAVWGENLSPDTSGTAVLDALKPHIKAVVDLTA